MKHTIEKLIFWTIAPLIAAAVLITWMIANL